MSFTTTTTASFADNATAQQLYTEGKYQEALVEYHKLIQSNPVAANYLGLAQTYKKLNHTIHAIEALNEGIARNPQSLELQLLLAQTHLGMHNANAAKNIIEPLSHVHHDNLTIVALYMNILIALGDYQKGLELIPFLSKNASNHAGILNNIGLIYIETGDMHNAIASFRKGFRTIIANPLPKAAPKAQEFMDPGLAKKGLLATKKALDELGIPFLLIAGTILGIHRDGDLLPHDKDVDLGLPWEIPRVELIHALRHYNFVCNYTEEDIAGEKGQWNISLVHVPTGTTIDFFFIKPENNQLVTAFYKNGKIFYMKPRNMGRSQIQYAGETWWTYGNLDLFLEEYYGKDWRIPQANHNAIILSDIRYDPDGVAVALCYNHCLGALCEAYYKKGHGYAMQLLSVHDDPLLLKLKNYLEKNLSEEWYPPIPLRKNRTNNKKLFGIKD